MRFSLSLVVTMCVLGQVVPPGPGFVPFAGVSSGNGDHGPAVLGALSYPRAVAFDGQGNLYIADFGTASVRKVGTDGTITTVAGNGTDGFSGDGGSAIAAELSSPTGLAFDAAGNLYIADGPNARIRRVSTTGIITTFAGNGDASILRPWQIAIDSNGNIYAADGDESNVRKIDTTGKITLVAGNGQLGFSGDGGPATAAMIDAVGVAVDAAGNVLIAGGGRIRKVTPDGKIATLADGTGTNNKFDGGGLWISPAGPIYMADTANNRALRFNADGTGMEVLAGTGGNGYSEGCGTAGAPFKKLAANAQLANPWALTLDASGAVFIADSANRRVRKVTADGLIVTVAGPDNEFSGDGGPAKAATFSSPAGIAFDSAGAMYIADSFNNRIRKITPDGIIHTIAGDGGPTAIDDPACFAPNDSFLRRPTGIAVDKHGNIFIADRGNNRIRKVAANGVAVTIAGTGKADYTGDGGPASEAALNSPLGVAVDAAGDVFINDSMNNAIREVTPDGIIRTAIFQSGGVFFDAAGNFYYGGPFFVHRKAEGGATETVAGTGDFQGSIVPGGPFNGPADLGFAESIAVSPDGTLAVGDSFANRVQRVAPSCAIDIVSQGAPDGLAYDAKGNLFLAEGGIWELPAGVVPPPQGPAPEIGAIGVFNAASLEVIPPPLGEPPGPFSREPIAPGEILLLHGICMGPQAEILARYDSNGMVPRKLAETKVMFDDVAAPLIYVQSGLVEVVAPYELAGKSSTTMTVINQGRRASKNVGVVPGISGIFTMDGLGFGQAAASNADGTLNSPANPAMRGKLISLYATGLGQTNPPGVDGQRVKGIVTSRETVTVTIAGQNAKVVFAGDVPGFVGLSQVNAIVPEQAAPSVAAPVSIMLGNSVSAQMATIAIK